MSSTRTPADIAHMAQLALDNAVTLGIEPQGSRLILEQGEPSAGVPWRLFIVHPGQPGHAAPAFLTDHGFIGNTKSQAFDTLNTVQWALQTAIMAQRGGQR